jgi:hypothetical protein
VTDVKPEDYPPHLQWATDTAGRRYWIQGGPVIGRSGWRAYFSQKPAPPEIRGVVMVTRVEGDERTEVFVEHYITLDEARAKAVDLAAEVEVGTFQEKSPR